MRKYFAKPKIIPDNTKKLSLFVAMTASPIFKVLPSNPKETGKTRKQIAAETGLSPEKAGTILQVLKRHGLAKHYKGKWRQTKQPLAHSLAP